MSELSQETAGILGLRLRGGDEEARCLEAVTTLLRVGNPRSVDECRRLQVACSQVKSFVEPLSPDKGLFRWFHISGCPGWGHVG